MKVTGARRHDTWNTYAVEFDDSMVVILNEKLEYLNMLSLGTESYYAKKGKFPKGKNLEKRVTLGQEWISRNANRYKKAKKS
jgi:hypothetical protein